MQKMKSKQKRINSNLINQDMSNNANERKNKLNSFLNKYASLILITILTLAIITVSFAWFNGIRFSLEDPEAYIEISKASTLHNNVDVVGFSFDENGHLVTESPTPFLTNEQVDEIINQGETPENRAFFAGDYFEPGALNKLDSSSSSYLNDYYAVINANTNTKYLRVVNRANMDIAVKIQFQLAPGLNQDVNDLSAFWYLITDVTNEVSKTGGDGELTKLSNYASNNKASRLNEFNENNANTKVFTNLTRKVKLGEILEDKTANGTGNVAFYRIDYGLCESALKSSGVNYFGKNIECNIYIFYGQVNAPDDDDINAFNEVREIWTREDLLAALTNVNEAYNGDTLKFMADITVEGDLNVIRPLNFDLNGHRLTIDNGNFVVSHNSSIPMTFNLTKKGSILIKGTPSSAQNYIAGNFELNAPNSSITIIGDNASSAVAAGEDAYDIKLSGYIIDGVGNNDDGLKLESTYVQKYTFNIHSDNSEIGDFSRVKIKDGCKLTIGEFVKVDVINTDEITSCFIDNYGTVGWMNLSSLRLVSTPILKLRIYNNGYIGGNAEGNGYGITLPPLASQANTQIIKGPLSNNFTITGSSSFTEAQITDENAAEFYVREIPNEDSAYEVFLVPNISSTDNSVLKYVFESYFTSASSYSSIKKLVIKGRKGVYLNEYDIDFLMEKDGSAFVFRDLNYIDMSSISIENTTYSTESERKNRIKNDAFKNKSNLTTFILPDDLVYIGKNAFLGTGLTAITIPSNVQYVGQDAFKGVHDVTIKSSYPVSNPVNFLQGFTHNAYFFVYESFVDDYKENFYRYNNHRETFKNHVYCYAERNGDYYVRVLDPELRNLEIVAYIGDYSINTSICPNEYLFEGITYHVTSIGRDAYINITNINDLSDLQISIGTDTLHIGQEAFLNLNEIGAITSSATSIDYRAFYGCEYLKRVNLNGACVIGEEAFAHCTSLEEANLTNTISLGIQSFADCRVLKTLIMPKVRSIGAQAFMNCRQFEYVELGELQTITEGTFNNCTKLHTVILSNETTEIGENAFNGCTALKVISCDKDVTEDYYLYLDKIMVIGEAAFNGCSSFKYVYAPELVEINADAFRGCNSLEYFVSSTVQRIGDYAFYKLSNLSMIEIENVKTIGSYAFNDTGIIYAFIPNALTIGDYAFYNCKKINAISLGNVNSIGNSAFIGVQPYYVDMSAYVFPDDITTLPSSLEDAYGANQDWHDFSRSVKIYFKSNEARDSSAQIAKRDYFFKLFSLASSERNGNTITYYGNLEKEYLYDKYEFVGDWYFYSNDYDDTDPNNIIGLKKNIYTYNVYTMGDINNLQGELMTYHGKELVGNIVIPYKEYLPDGILDTNAFNDKNSAYYSGEIEGITITKIGDYAFQSINVLSTEASINAVGDNFSHVVFANSVTEIGNGAFRYSKLNFVNCNNVESIGNDAFRNATNLRYVDLGNTITIGDYAFSSFTSVTVSNRVYTSIEQAYYATNAWIKPSFTGSLLTKVIFRHVDKIGEGSFFLNALTNNIFCLLDMSENRPKNPLTKEFYDTGYGLNGTYNRPSDVHLFWLGFSSNRRYYEISTNVNDINVICPAFSEEKALIWSSFMQIMPNSINLLYDYNYVYMPDYKINDVEVGMFMLSPWDISNLSSGFTIYKSFIRNLCSDLDLEGLSVVDEDNKRYLYTVPDKVDLRNVYNTESFEYVANGEEASYVTVNLASYAFKSTYIKSGYICDLSLADGITNIPSSCFQYCGFRIIYTGKVKTISSYAFSESSLTNIHTYRVETIGAYAFYDSGSLTSIDLRENKADNGDTIYCTFDNNFLEGTSAASIYINSEDLDEYISRTKGVIIRTGYQKQLVEIYAYFKVVGTHLGHLDLYYKDTYNLETILSPYTTDTSTTYQRINWYSTNPSVIDIVNGEIVIKEDLSSALHEPYTSGTSTIYCEKITYNNDNDNVVSTELLGKFIVDIIIRDDTRLEYYNFSVSNTKVNDQYSGYTIYTYNGICSTDSDNVFNPSVEFDNFMSTYAITNSWDNNYKDNKNCYVLKTKLTEEINNQNVTSYKIFDIALSSYWTMDFANDTIMYLYTDKYITKIGDYAFYKRPFNEIWLEAVTRVGRRSFANESAVNNLKIVVMPFVEVIEYQAFYGNTVLEDVVIGTYFDSSLTTLEEEAFKNCIKLAHFAPIANNFTDLSNRGSLSLYGYGLGPSYEVNADHLMPMEMSEYVGKFDTIGEDYVGVCWLSFIYKYEYTVGENKYTSYMWADINHMNMHGVSGIDKFIYLPPSVTTMGIGVFQGCSTIEHAGLPANEDFTRVANYTFYGCKNLRYVRLPSNIITIGDYAFQNCENLVSDYDYSFTENDYTITLDGETHNNINYLYTNYLSTYEGVNNYYGINLNYVQTISQYAFRNCYVLDKISLDNIKSIGAQAFYSCESLSEIIFENNTNNSNVSFGSNWNGVTAARKRYYVTEANKRYFSNAKYLYVRDIEIGDYLVQRIVNSSTGEIRGLKIVAYNGDVLPQIPKYMNYDGTDYPVLTIGSYAYSGVSLLSDEIHDYIYEGSPLVDTVVLPEFVTTVEDHAFSETVFRHYIEEINLDHVVFPVSYGNYAFSNNILLQDVKFTRMASGGSRVFDGCTSFTKMDVSENVNQYKEYSAPVINDDFFTGSPAKAVCTIKAEEIERFRSPGYQGRVFESSSTTVGDYQILALTSDTVSIIRYVGSNPISGAYHIPDTIDGKTVTTIGVGAFKGVEVSNGATLTIGPNVVSIGEYAFYDTIFGQITIEGESRNLTIGNFAFGNMTSLVSADIGIASTIGTHVFDGDLYMGSVVLPSSLTKIPDYTFNECTNLNNVNFSGFSSLVEIGEYAFSGCTSLSQMIVNRTGFTSGLVELGNVNKIGGHAFDGCINIRDVIAVLCNNIGDYAFKNCSALSSYQFKNSISNFTLGIGVFYGCKDLSTITELTTFIPDYTFYGCTSLTSVTLANARSIGNYAFYGCSGIETAYLGINQLVYNYAFYNCKNLSTLDLGSTNGINDYAFGYCINLHEINFANVTTVGAYAFTHAGLRDTLDLKYIETIGSFAFEYNVNLETVQFKYVNSIGEGVFANDNNILSFDFTTNSRLVGSTPQLGAPNVVNSKSLNNVSSDFYIYIPDGSTYLSTYQSRFNTWKHRIFETGITVGDYIVKEVTLTKNDSTEVSGYQIIRYIGEDKLPSVYNVPQRLNGLDVISVGHHAFYNSLENNDEVSVLNFGTNIIYVGDYAFYNYQFGTISMPNVEKIGNYAFYGNKEVGYLSLPNVSEIGQYAFASCPNIKVVRLYNSIREIKNNAFKGCEDLRSVYFESQDPTNITFGSTAFGNLNESEVILRVPTGCVQAYKDKNNLSYYKDRIKEGEITDADFSYRISIEGYNGVNPIYGIEIVSYEGQATSVEVPSTLNVSINEVMTSVEVVRILDYAFENALNLSDIYIPNTLKYISSHAFMGSRSITNVYNSLTSTYTPSVSTFRCVDGILYMVDGSGNFTTLVYYPVNKTGATFNFTRTGYDFSTLNTIYENAFYGNTFLADITVPASVKYIGENAFGYMPSLNILEFSVPTSGTAVVPTLYGSNILTNCNSDLIIVVGSSVLNSFKNDVYFGYYKSRFTTSRP